MLCKYGKLFGEVNKGVHSIRLYNIAIIDVIFTLLGAGIIHFFFQKYSFYCILLFLFITSIVAHRVFCVRTTIDKLLFP